jgi:hypothetical protein
MARPVSRAAAGCCVDPRYRVRICNANGPLSDRAWPSRYGCGFIPSHDRCLPAAFSKQEWIVADMRKLALQRTFSGILAWDSFFHLCYDDQRRMFPVFRAHAAPNAALMFTSGLVHGEAIGSFGGEPLYHASLDPSEYRSLLDRNGFHVVSHVVEDPNCGGHTIWLAQLI